MPFIDLSPAPDYKHVTFTMDDTESLSDLDKRAREWVDSHSKVKIDNSVYGNTWSVEKNRYVTTLTLSYIEK